MCCIEWIWYAGRVARCAIWLVALAPIRVVSHSERLVLPQNLLTADNCLSTRLWSNTWVTSHKYQSINHQANQNQSDNLNVLGEFQLSKGYLQKVIHISFLYEVKPFKSISPFMTIVDGTGLLLSSQNWLVGHLCSSYFAFLTASSSWRNLLSISPWAETNF